MRETIQNANGKQFHAVSLSGGKDSSAMLLLMIERGMPINMVLSADTGMEFSEMYEHLAKLDEHLFRERGMLRKKQKAYARSILRRSHRPRKSRKTGSAVPVKYLPFWIP